MNWLDILLLVFLVFGLIEGFKTGLILQLTGIVALLLALLLVGHLVPYISPYLQSIITLSTTTHTILVYIVSFVIIVLSVFCIGLCVHFLFKLPILNSLNKLLGALFSVLKWGILLSVVLFVFAKLDKNGQVLSKPTRDSSILYNHLMAIPRKFLEK